MRNPINLSNFGPIGIMIGVLGLAFAGWQAVKTNEVTKKLDISMNDIESKVPVEIQQSIVDAAIVKAVDREVQNASAIAVEKVRKDIHDEIAKAVKKEVKEAYDTLKEEVSDKISEQVADIDVYALQNDVKKKAEKLAMQKLDSGMNGILTDFKNGLGGIQQLWNTAVNAGIGFNSGSNRQSNGNGMRISFD